MGSGLLYQVGQADGVYFGAATLRLRSVEHELFNQLLWLPRQEGQTSRACSQGPAVTDSHGGGPDRKAPIHPVNTKGLGAHPDCKVDGVTGELGKALQMGRGQVQQAVAVRSSDAWCAPMVQECIGVQLSTSF